VAEKKSGALFYENVVVSPVFDSGGNIINYVCVKHDQTEQRRLEDERMHLEMKYRQAQKMESIGRLAGGVAHDLNNLLGPILGYSELIRETMTPPGKIRKAVNKIHYAGERARDVVSQLLAFGRKQRLSLSVLDIGDVIRHFEPLIRRTLREDIHLEINKPTMPFWIRADRGQVEQILMNLVVNAQDAMPRGGRLTIETTEVAATEAFPGAVTAETCVRLVISDTGHGMDEKVLGNLFEPFFTTKGTGEGTGLGLSMVYGTVQQHDGVIRVKSEPGEGASFFIYFPLTTPEAAPAARKQADAVERGSETVMLVEDDDGIREMIETILTHQGYQVLSAVAGPDCLGMLEGAGDSVDLLLTDIIMPGMNGRELYAEVMKKHPGMKVIYMSGYSADVLAAHGAVFDGINFIQKPFTIQSVCSKVRQVLDA
jgi:signal transduction histidine kinase/ActR/RegA family two-component response regulator